MTNTFRVHGLECADEAIPLREALQSRPGVRELSFDLLRGLLIVEHDEAAITRDDLIAAVVLDIGGEGRHPWAWNLNPSRVKTVGPQAGQPIPRLIAGRAEAIPLADDSVSVIIVERTPLRLAALREIWRVATPGAVIVLRHARPPWSDPHQLAANVFDTSCRRSWHPLGRHLLQESVFTKRAPHDHIAIPSPGPRLCGGSHRTAGHRR